MMTLLLLFIVYAIALSAALSWAGHRCTSAPSAGPPRPRPTRILIVGATGGTGRQLVSQALDQGYAVTALVRDPARLQLHHPRLTVVQGDVLDPATVDARPVPRPVPPPTSRVEVDRLGLTGPKIAA